MLIIKNGNIIDPIEDAVYPADLCVKDGVIAKIVRRSENTSDENCGYEEKEKECGDVEEESGCEVFDAKGMLIAPGLADTPDALCLRVQGDSDAAKAFNEKMTFPTKQEGR